MKIKSFFVRSIEAIENDFKIVLDNDWSAVIFEIEGVDLLKEDPIAITTAIESSFLKEKLGEDFYCYEFHVAKVIEYQQKTLAIIQFRGDAEELEKSLM